METKKDFYKTSLGKKSIMQLIASSAVSFISIIALVGMYLSVAGEYSNLFNVLENETGVVVVAVITLLLLLLTSHFEGRLAGAIAQFKEQ